MEDSAEDSSWGLDGKLLQIGDRTVDFELASADGSTVRLRDYIGDKAVIVATCRGFW